LRQQHKAGEKLFVDWAGATIPIYGRTSSEVRQAHLFVAVLGSSSYTYAQATSDEQMINWLDGADARVRVRRRGATTGNPGQHQDRRRACLPHEPDLNPTYQHMAMHYGVGVVPARPYKPRDKAKVEGGVLVVERWIIAALRNQGFFSIEEVNGAVRELLVKLNQRPFRKREGSRSTLFQELDKPALAPRPADRFDLSEWSKARVNIDYHVVFDDNYYSVPYNIMHEVVEIRSSRPQSRSSAKASASPRTCAAEHEAGDHD
jgi:hypothetical protein